MSVEAPGVLIDSCVCTHPEGSAKGIARILETKGRDEDPRSPRVVERAIRLSGFPVRSRESWHIFPDKLIRVRCNDSVLPAYFWKLVQMQFTRSQIEAAARTAVGNYAIGSDHIWALRFPLPPLTIQEAMVKRVDARLTEIAKLKADAKARAGAAKADVEAMILGTKPVA